MKTRDLVGYFSLAGKGALITGGGSGLGLAVAEAFVQYGAAVSVVEVDEDAATEVAKGITTSPAPATASAGRSSRVRPHAGGRFVIEPGVAGLPISPLAG